MTDPVIRDPRLIPDDDPPPPLGGWLLNRLAEREQAVRTAVGSVVGATLTWGGEEMWSADKTLAEVAAHRRIVELHDMSHECSTYDHNGDVDNCTWVTGYCSTMRLLALSFADHPTYRQEWRL